MGTTWATFDQSVYNLSDGEEFITEGAGRIVSLQRYGLGFKKAVRAWRSEWEGITAPGFEKAREGGGSQNAERKSSRMLWASEEGHGQTTMTRWQ